MRPMPFMSTCRLLIAIAVLGSFIGAGRAVLAGPYSDAVLADNPIAYYRLGETAGTTAANLGSGTGIDAEYKNENSGSGGYLLGQPGPQAPEIPGFESDNLSLHLTPVVGSNLADDNFPRVEVEDLVGGNDLAISGAITLEAWIKRDEQLIAPGNNEGIAGRYQGSGEYGAERAYVLYYDSDIGGSGGLGLAFSETGAFQSAYSFTTTVDIPVGQWTHVAGVMEPNTRMAFYVNGALVEERLTDVPASLYTGPSDFWIGQQYNSASTWTFEGNIDEVAIYDTALSGDAIAAHYAMAVPEPTALALLGAGLTTVAGSRLRRRTAVQSNRWRRERVRPGYAAVPCEEL